MHIESWVWPQDMDRWGCFANTIEIVYCSDFCDGQGFYILRARSPSMTCAFGCNWVELWAYFLAQDFKHDLVNLLFCIVVVVRFVFHFPEAVHCHVFLGFYLVSLDSIVRQLLSGFGQLLSGHTIPIFFHIVLHGPGVMFGFARQRRQDLADFVSGWGLIPGP